MNQRKNIEGKYENKKLYKMKYVYIQEVQNIQKKHRKIYTIKVKKEKKKDGVGPVDNRPYIDQPHHFVEEEKN